MKNANFDIYEMVTENMLKAMENDVIPWSQPWRGGMVPRNAINNKPYRGINTFILGFKPYTSPFWLSIDQANKLGGNVKKGEKCTYIVFWKFLKANDGLDRDGNPRTKSVPLLRYFKVWNVEQCEKLKLPKHCNLDESKLDFNPIEECEKIVAAYKKCPTITNLGQSASYSLLIDTINMPTKESFHSVEAYYATLFHEMGHSTRHKDRLNRKNLNGEDPKGHVFGSEDYSFEELVAEMTAAYLCAVAGIEHKIGNNSAAYLKHWLEKLRKDKKMLVQAAGKAQKAADYIMGLYQDEIKDEGETEE